MPTFDGSSTSTLRAWREYLATFFQLYPVTERKVVYITTLHLEGEAKDWWFSHLSHAKVTSYANLFQILKKRYGGKKLETYHIVTSPIIEEIVHEEPKKYVLIITQEEEPLPPPPAAYVLTSGGGSLASLQDGLEFLTFGVLCMIQEMHDEEETDTSVGTIEEMQPSSLPRFGETIASVGGTLVDVQDVP